jgi:hypothetical protein
MKYCGEERESETGQFSKQRKRRESKKAMRRKSGSRRICVGRETDTHEDEGEDQHPKETVREVGEETGESRCSRSVKCEGAMLPRYRPTSHLRGNLVEAFEACRCEGKEEGGRRKENGVRKKGEKKRTRSAMAPC